MLVILLAQTISLAVHRVPASAATATARRAFPVAFFGGKLPAEVAELAPSTDPKDVEPLWAEFRKCYKTEAEAIRAAQKTPLVVLPFFNTKDNIRFCWQILGNELGFSDEERREIVTSNPGVLANKPYELASSSQDEVRFAVQMAQRVDAVPESVRFAIPTVTTLAIVAIIAKRLLIDCAGATCG